MNYYFLPGTGIYGGIKAGYHFAEALSLGGATCSIATPDGTSATWFSSRASVVSQEQALANIGEETRIIFSLPHDYEKLKLLGVCLYFHCQGTDPLIDSVIKDEDVQLLHSWPQAGQYMKDKTGRDSIDVSLMIPDCFYYDGALKREGSVAYMPRRDNGIVDACREKCPGLTFVPIEKAKEQRVSDIMKTCDCYLATSVGEWFGLPALEAMAAGCIVLSVPVVGGTDYLEDGVNGILSNPESMPDQLNRLMSDEQQVFRSSLRVHGVATANRYRSSFFRRHIRDQLSGPLEELCK